MTKPIEYQAVFNHLEATLIRTGNQRGRKHDIRETLDAYRTVSQESRSDDDYFRMLVKVVFYSGFKAATVDKKLPAIERHFSDYRQVAGYDDRDYAAIIADPQMLRNGGKIRACIKNAQQFRTIVQDHGSFQNYLDGFSRSASSEKVMELRKDLRSRFDYLGGITSYHFLTDIGMPVLKPDRVIRRIFSRLGLVEDAGEGEKRLCEVVAQGAEFARSTGLPIRYIDSVFVSYGQVTGDDPEGLAQGICLGDHPRCDICGVKAFCRYEALS
jgi:DNA-3-methyladenine glycosylase I